MKALVFKIVFALIGIAIVAGISIAGAYTYFNLDLPKIEKLQDYKPNLASQIISKDGVILAELGLEKREIVEIADVPPLIINAFLSAEDDKFFEHKGVDYLGLSRAMLANFKAGRVVQGGSTITQQVAKSLLLTSERSFTRKLKDFILAQRIEEKLTKNEILYLYLNQVYLGGGFYGVKAAARGYFDKELNQITHAEAAMLAGLLVAPGKYSPYVRPAAAKMRQSYVLNRLHTLKKITDEEYKSAMEEKIVYRLKQEELKAGYFTEWVRQQVVAQVGEKPFLIGGYKVETTLDWQLQQVAEAQVKKGIKDIDKRQGYKGPLAVIKNEEISDFEKNLRISLTKDRSSYFTIGENNEKEYEYNYKEDVLNELKSELALKQNALDSTDYMATVNEKDPIIDTLKEGQEAQAIVLKIDNKTRIIYVSIAGAIGIIPLENYKWAYKRSISENPTYKPTITLPREVAKVGDVLLVTIDKKSVNLLPYVHKDSRDGVTKDKKFDLVKNDKYILCELDQAPEVQGAIFSMNSQTGEIISYVGGSDYAHSKFNRVIQAKRQPGSAFKPLIYASALEHGYEPTTIIMDTPEALPGFDSASSWKPKNYNGKYKGPMTMRDALEQSQNIPTIKIADRVGVNNIIKFTNRLGFNAKLDNNLGIALGTFVISPRDLVMSFAVLANGGKYILPKGILQVTDRDGKIVEVSEGQSDFKIPQQMMEKEESAVQIAEGQEVEEPNPFLRNLAGNQVYDPRLAYVINSMLRGVIQSGTGGAAREISRNIAGKTGTTNDYIDAWFVGYSPKIVTAVWNGFDDNKTLGFGETGGKAPVIAWREFMRSALAKYGDVEFPIPAGITQEWVNKETGKKATPYSAGAILESFADVPRSFNEESVDTGVMTTPLGDDEYFENQ